MKQNFIPADATINELSQQADDCDAQAATAQQPVATELREKAKLLRAWIADLRSARWTA
jgi:hypothetical protein